MLININERKWPYRKGFWFTETILTRRHFLCLYWVSNSVLLVTTWQSHVAFLDAGLYCRNSCIWTVSQREYERTLNMNGEFNHFGCHARTAWINILHFDIFVGFCTRHINKEGLSSASLLLCLWKDDWSDESYNYWFISLFLLYLIRYSF